MQGDKLLDVPVYVLTSNRTFSAAEEFTDNLKNLERATVIGETTGGDVLQRAARFRRHERFVTPWRKALTE